MISKSTLLGTLFSLLWILCLRILLFPFKHQYGKYAAKLNRNRNLNFSLGFSNLYRKSNKALNPSKILGFIVGALIGFGFNIKSIESNQSIDLTVTLAEVI